MCGIAGLAGLDAARHEHTVAAMATSQAHRGPDGTQHLACVDGHAVLAMNTLLIVDRDAAPGPYRDDESGLLLTFNGEIYNYVSLAASWGIPLAAGETDTHLVLRAWSKFGPSCLEAMDGMFALAVYDPRSGTLALARDRLGEKPLYWTLDGGRIAFASEVATLAGYGPAPLVVRPEMMAIETPTGQDTPFQGIQLMSPATLLTFSVTTASVDQRTWWRLEDAQPWTGDYEDAVSEFSATLTEQVPLRAPSVDWALLLSGGLDSCLLAYIMRPPVCVTVRYGQDRLDESEIARAVARDIGAELVVVEPGIDDFVTALPNITTALDYPMGNAATFSEYMAYQAVAKRGIRVVVGGLGPDELLMGYVRHALAIFGPHAVLAAGLEAYRPLAARLMHPAGEPLTPAETVTRLILRGADPQRGIHDLVADALRRAGGDLARGLTLAELATAWRPLVMTSDKLASSLSLERRSPFLARELVELAYRLPSSYKIQDPASGKRILRDTARTLGLPQEIWDSRDKIGFASPVPAWLTGPLAPWADTQIRTALAAAPATLRPLLESGLMPGSRYSRTRMQALMAAAWLSDQSVRAAA